jgi:hypothetical protein
MSLYGSYEHTGVLVKKDRKKNIGVYCPDIVRFKRSVRKSFKLNVTITAARDSIAAASTWRSLVSGRAIPGM